jgi:ubiquinone/menaquinone biosynthesis C-methylase UbiE
MSTADTEFAGSIPAAYDRYMVPMLFEPYAQDMAQRAAALSPRRILEIAAGTGVVTRALVAAMPDAVIVATDLNQPMLDVASSRIDATTVTFLQADAQALPVEDAAFDLVVCQFGVMFFPDRVAAYREARRVLKPEGRFLFNSWNRVEENELTLVLAETLTALLPDDPPSFYRRIPFGYHDPERIRADLEEAAFDDISIETVAKRSRLGSVRDAAIGICLGSPMRTELEERAPGRLGDVVEAVADALARVSGPDGVDLPMSAHVVSARA